LSFKDSSPMLGLKQASQEPEIAGGQFFNGSWLKIWLPRLPHVLAAP
jgi:hypothetical protein